MKTMDKFINKVIQGDCLEVEMRISEISKHWSCF